MQHISSAHQYLELLHKRLRENEVTLNRTTSGPNSSGDNNDLRANVFAMNEQRQRLEP